jgi:gas vesicle protein
MKTYKIFNGIFSGLFVLAISAMTACEPPRDAEKTREGEARIETREQTVDELDTRIRDLNQEISSVERSLRTEEREVDRNVRNSWNDIEDKRQNLNENIERYNSAVQMEAELEASRIMGEIETQVSELEVDLREFRDEFARDTDRDEEIPN